MLQPPPESACNVVKEDFANTSSYIIIESSLSCQVTPKRVLLPLGEKNHPNNTYHVDQYALKKGPVRKVPFRRGLTETSEPNPPPSFSEAKLVNSGYSENMLLKFVSMDRPPNLGYESFRFFSSLQPKLCTPVYDLIQGWPPAVGLILFPFGLSDNSNSMREAAYKSQQ